MTEPREPMDRLRTDAMRTLRRLHLWDHEDCGRPVEQCPDREYRRLAESFAAIPEADDRLRAALDAALSSLDEDDLMYDHPYSASGEPTDPVLHVNYERLRAALASEQPGRVAEDEA